MKWLKCSTVLTAVVISGVVLYKKCDQQLLTPQQALRAVKQAAKYNYDIDGSWIHMTPESILRYDLPYTVYRGGITTSKNNQVSHYDFIIDATTGTLIELIPN